MTRPNAQGLYLWQCNAEGRESGTPIYGRPWRSFFRVFVTASDKDIARAAALAWLQMAAPGVGEPAPDRIKMVMLKSDPPQANVWRDGEVVSLEIVFAPR